jgi:pimeloyl-ACP methyl ester carboxylesterase
LLPKSLLPKTRPSQAPTQLQQGTGSSTTELATEPQSSLPHVSSLKKPKYSLSGSQPAAPQAAIDATAALTKNPPSVQQAESETAGPQVQLPQENQTLTPQKDPVPTGFETAGLVVQGGTTSPAAVAAPTPPTTPVQLKTALTPPAITAPAITPAALAPTAITPPRLPLIRLIGTLFFNALSIAEKVVVGPPVLPPGSTVTVSQSTLEVGDITVPADWYFPAGPDPPTGIIYLQHGFFATGPMYSYTAATLAEQTHSIVVAPSLSSNFLATDGNWLGGTALQRAAADLFVDDRAALTASASAAAGHPVTLPQKFVLVGHSLGGGFVTAMAGFTGASDDLAGVVLLDPVGLNNAIPIAVAKLPDDLPVLMISSPPYFWNSFGIASTELVAARPGQFVGVQLVGGRHIDAMQGGNPLIQLGAYVVAGFSRPQNIEAVKVLEVGWINDMFAGTRIYAAPGETIQIGTSAGTATAIALPTPPTLLSPITDLARVLFKLGSDVLFGFLSNDPGPAAVPMSAQTGDLTQLSASKTA